MYCLHIKQAAGRNLLYLENIGYCKPNPDDYREMEIVKRLGVQPEKCLLAGNDVTEDMIVKETGMQVLLRNEKGWFSASCFHLVENM